MAGFDTASFVQDVQSQAVRTYGRPLFWIRYFPPSANTTLDRDAVTECQAIWDSGARALGPISAPTQSRLAGSAAEGQADAHTFASALLSTYFAVGPLFLPANNMLLCWLDMESGTSLSVDYWNGWSGTIDGFQFPAGSGNLPLYPALYCNPHADPSPCTTLANSTANYSFAVWSSEPEPCTKSITNPPTWNAESCPQSPTNLWQYAEAGIAGCLPAQPSVDLDVGAPGVYYPDYCFQLTGRP